MIFLITASYVLNIMFSSMVFVKKHSEIIGFKIFYQFAKIATMNVVTSLRVESVLFSSGEYIEMIFTTCK